MKILLAVALLHMHFTAPADHPALVTKGAAVASPGPVREYVFFRLEMRGTLTRIPGYADPGRHAQLAPHAPGTRESVWLDPLANGEPTTVYVVSVGTNGSRSDLSNGCVVGRGGATTAGPPATGASLAVPIVRQSRERCGQAALAMVLRYYGADTAALREVDGAYDPVLHGSLITDLAVAARRAGYAADISTLTPDSLIELLHDGVPPIVLYQNGSGPLTVRHFGVVTAWDAGSGSFTLLDGGASPRVTRRGDLEKRWETAGSQALIVRQAQP